MADLLLAREPQVINIEADVLSSFTTNVDFDFDMSGYTITAAVDTNDGNSVSFTVTNTDLAAGQFKLDLTLADMTEIERGTHHWYCTWTNGADVRTHFAGTFNATKYGE